MNSPEAATTVTNSSKDFIKIAVEEWGTWVRLHRDDNEKLYITGPMRNFLDILSDKLNFDYVLSQPADHVWGMLLSNGSWTGMLGMLQREEAEFALGPFGVSASRATVCDFSVSVKTESTGIMIVRPTLQSDVTGFLKPFDLTVWILIIASLAAVFATFAVVMWGEGRIFHREHKNPVATSALWVVKALTQECTHRLPKTDGSRVVVATWLLASLVFMSSYSSILTAKLTVPKVDIPINSMQDLVTQNEIPWRLESGSFLLQYFKEAPGGVRKLIFDGHTGNVPDCWAAREPISAGEFAVICDHTSMKNAMSWDFSTTGACHLYRSKEVINTFNLAVAFRASSKYREQSDYWILKMKESGIIEQWLNQGVVNTSHCLKPPSADFSSQKVTPLGFKSFVGPMLALAAVGSLDQDSPA
ncbi:probable glutamate receptor [Macrobrachium rosenbergii]|uniref:probable glutamate receptor n=1 Tax=Macrobrachium rosenbergii TaxID=79674 RepID=UPI0034D51A4E